MQMTTSQAEAIELIGKNNGVKARAISVVERRIANNTGTTKEYHQEVLKWIIQCQIVFKPTRSEEAV